MTTTRSQSAPALQRPDGTPVRVLVVDDEPNLTELLSMALRYEGWEVRTAASGLAAVRAAKDFGPDAVVLDMMLPDFDGLEVLRRMRGDDPNVPVLFLTAKDAVEDRVAGLTAGGDDYVTKPFSLEEVVARLRALMRRTTVAADEGSSLLVVGDLTMDEDSHEVTRAGEQIHLTATEFELLRYLMRNPKRVLSKAQILDRVWNYDFGGQANVVELYISYLRKKIDVGPLPDDPHDARRRLRAQARRLIGLVAGMPHPSLALDAADQAARLGPRAVHHRHARDERPHRARDAPVPRDPAGPGPPGGDRPRAGPPRERQRHGQPQRERQPGQPHPPGPRPGGCPRGRRRPRPRARRRTASW